VDVSSGAAAAHGDQEQTKQHETEHGQDDLD